MTDLSNRDVVRSRTDFDKAVEAALGRLGITWEALIVQAYSGQWQSDDARLTWKTIQETIGLVK